MTLSEIANKYYKAKSRNELSYNSKKVCFRLYCCRTYPDYQMKENYKFDKLKYIDSSIKLVYKNKLVAELTKSNCVWISAIYLESKYVTFKLVDYDYADVE